MPIIYPGCSYGNPHDSASDRQKNPFKNMSTAHLFQCLLGLWPFFGDKTMAIRSPLTMQQVVAGKKHATELQAQD